MSSSLPPRPSQPTPLFAANLALPKAELHLHMEGAIEPATVVALAARHGDLLDASAVSARYASRTFAAFLDAYKWVTSYLREPEDYALVARRLGEQLLAQQIVYAEVTLSVGVMLLRKQDVTANFRAIREATAPFAPRGLRLQWIFDAVRQFGPASAHEVARRAAELRSDGVVAFGLGGDELSVPAAEFRAGLRLRRRTRACLASPNPCWRGRRSRLRPRRRRTARRGAHRTWDRDHSGPRTHLLTDRARHPARNMPHQQSLHRRACASGRRLGSHDNVEQENHPLPRLLRAGVPISISTDDPAMFETDLRGEYLTLPEMGLSATEILALAEAAFHHAFLPSAEKAALLAGFRQRAVALGLL